MLALLWAIPAAALALTGYGILRPQDARPLLNATAALWIAVLVFIIARS